MSHLISSHPSHIISSHLISSYLHCISGISCDSSSEDSCSSDADYDELESEGRNIRGVSSHPISPISYHLISSCLYCFSGIPCDSSSSDSCNSDADFDEIESVETSEESIDQDREPRMNFNPYLPSGIVHPYQFDKSNSSFRNVCVYFFILILFQKKFL